MQERFPGFTELAEVVENLQYFLFINMIETPHLRIAQVVDPGKNASAFIAEKFMLFHNLNQLVQSPALPPG